MFLVNEHLKQRAELRKRADALLTASKTRELNPAEIDELADATTRISQISTNLDIHNSGEVVPGFETGPIPGVRRIPSSPSNPSKGKLQAFQFPEVGNFLRTRDPGPLASLQEGGELQYVVPGTQIDSFLAAYPSVDVFAQAGADINELGAGWVNGNYPIVASGEDAAVYSEGAGPTTDKSAKVYVAKLDSPSKYQFLSLPSEEAWADITALAGALVQEGVKRVIFGIGKAVTAALVASMNAAGAVVDSVGDNYADVLNLIAAIPPAFAAPTNKWMMSRRTLAGIRNTRTAGDVSIPIFNPTTSQLLGFDVVNNDALAYGTILFGDFSHGVHIRRAGLAFQLMQEAYREVGAIGLRFTKRAQAAFFSDAADASDVEQPLYLCVLGDAEGS
jgi:HK97 family phage major capsid protein